MARKNSDDIDDDDYDKKRPRKIAKTVAMAVLLFTIGSLMLYFGVTHYYTDKDRAIGMLVVGGLSFLPGSYATWNLYGAWRGWPGYSYDAIPSYDDD